MRRFGKKSRMYRISLPKNKYPGDQNDDLTNVRNLVDINCWKKSHLWVLDLKKIRRYKYVKND